MNAGGSGPAVSGQPRTRVGGGGGKTPARSGSTVSGRQGPTPADVAPFAGVVVTADLPAGSRTYVDHAVEPPILVIDTGLVEVHLALPPGLVSITDLQICDGLLAAVAGWRVALIAHL